MYIIVSKNAHVTVQHITAQKRTQRRTFLHAKKKLHPFDTIETFSWRNSVEHYYQVLHKDDCVNHVNENTVGIDIVPTNWMIKPYNIHDSDSLFFCQLFVANINRPVGVLHSWLNLTYLCIPSTSFERHILQDGAWHFMSLIPAFGRAEAGGSPWLQG